MYTKDENNIINPHVSVNILAIFFLTTTSAAFFCKLHCYH